MFDYEFLRLLWWVLLGVLLIGIAVTDGFDLGVAILLPIAARTDTERRIVINTVGPVWEGNQVWLILGGGAIFAAWPALYAAAFSGFYFAMLLLLCALILRPVGFKFRSKIAAPPWRATWDGALFLGGLVPALVYGVAFGNVLLGVPFRFDETLRLRYEGSFLALFNPFSLLCGSVSVSMLTMHGAAYLVCKTEGIVRDRARRAGMVAGAALAVTFLAGGVWASGLSGFVLTAFGGVDGPSNPLLKQVARASGAWMTNYTTHPWMIAAPSLGLAGALATTILMWRGRAARLAFVTSALSVTGVIATAGCSLFPFLLPSSLEPDASLTVWDASASRLTLAVMAVVTAALLPLVIIYTAWVYRVLRGPVTEASVAADRHSY